METNLMSIVNFATVCSRLYFGSAYLRQSGARNIGKVMVLIVIANIERDFVQAAVIGISLKAFTKHIMLRYEMPCNWVQSHRH